MNQNNKSTYRPPTDHFFTVQLVHDYPNNESKTNKKDNNE